MVPRNNNAHHMIYASLLRLDPAASGDVFIDMDRRSRVSENCELDGVLPCASGKAPITVAARVLRASNRSGIGAAVSSSISFRNGLELLRRVLLWRLDALWLVLSGDDDIIGGVMVGMWAAAKAEECIGVCGTWLAEKDFGSALGISG